ncbi:MAG: FecR domain-containing protein [Deltaproteobacteria bacterium]|nr:FecR domain-containing protein [Deltaproteobacteria bacterium]
MTRNVIRLLLLSSLLALPLAAPAAEYMGRAGPGAPPGSEPEGNPAAGLGLSYVTYLTGDALFQSTDTEEWAALTPNLSLRIGDRLWAGDDAKIEVRLPGPATAWLSYQTELDLVDLRRDPRGDTIQMALVSGEASFDVGRMRAPDSVFQVDLPGVSLRAYGEARFRVNTLTDGSAQVGVVEGSLDLETPDGVVSVRGGQLADLRPDRRVVLDFLPPADPWDRWVQSRAEFYDRPAASARYLPPEMGPYAREFDRSGRWVTYAPYGWVWAPITAPGWSPYSNGRWVWSAGDYVWLSYDPWYAPFHYGRWNHSASLGWFWVAPRQAHWSPGYVAWSITDDDVGWVPLGHGELYYGYGDYGPNSVNVSISTRINVTHVYVNSRAANGVVVVRRDNFLRGRIVQDRIRETRNPFVDRGRGSPVVIARPPVRELRPTRDTRLPRPEVSIVPRARPPERVERESRAVRQRAAPRGRERSVFVPDQKPRPLRNVEKEQGVDQAVPPPRRPALSPAPGPEPRETRPAEQRRRQPSDQPAQRAPERRKQRSPDEPVQQAPEQPAQPPPGAPVRQAPERPARRPPEVPVQQAPERPAQRPPEVPPERPTRRTLEDSVRQPPERNRPAVEQPKQEAQPEREIKGRPQDAEMRGAPASRPERPVGKRQFRRVPEPTEGAPAAPAAAEPPKAQPEPQQQQQQEEEPRRGRRREEDRGR